MRLILAEAAVRSYKLATGAAPASLESLVPGYFSQVPIDPYSGKPLVYRCTAEGYLLYSVGSNRVDDGGQRTNLLQAAIEGVGDLFFDAHYPDEESDGTAANSGPAKGRTPNRPWHLQTERRIAALWLAPGYPSRIRTKPPLVSNPAPLRRCSKHGPPP